MSGNILSGIKDELIFLNYECNSKEELLTLIGKHLHELGYVKKSFSEAVLEREKNYPTGLATSSIPVAIPHADSIHTLKEGISFIRLSKPIKFKDMGGSEEEISAEFVFVLCILDPLKQLDVLKTLVGIFSNSQIMLELKNATSTRSIFDILKKL